MTSTIYRIIMQLCQKRKTFSDTIGSETKKEHQKQEIRQSIYTCLLRFIYFFFFFSFLCHTCLGFILTFHLAFRYSKHVQINCLFMKVIENHWALLDLAKAGGITNLNIECDALEAVKLLSNNLVSNMLFNSILNECRNSLQTFHEVKIQHCYREANKAADHLAKVGCH